LAQAIWLKQGHRIDYRGPAARLAMVRVYGVEIADAGMARTARWLINAQWVLCIIGVFAGVVGICRYSLTREAWNTFVEGTGQHAELKYGFRSDVLFMLQTLMSLVLPMALIFIARSAIQKNDKDLIGGLCILEGICSGCSLLSVVQLIQLIPWMFQMRSRVDSATCAMGIPVQECEDSKAFLQNSSSIAAIAMLIQLFLVVCQIGAFAAGSASAKQASQDLSQGLVFSGLPLAMPNTANTLQQPGLVGKVVMGIPVADHTESMAAPTVQGQV